MVTPYREKPLLPPLLALIIGVTASSTASVFIRLAQGTMNSLAVAAWRLILASLMLAPFALATRWDEWRTLKRWEWSLLLASGVILAVHFYTWITSLALTSVAASVVLVSTTPLFVGIISHFFFQERITRWVLLGMGVALAGSTMIGLSDLGEGTHRMLGDVLALAGALAAAGYLLIGRQLRNRLSLLGYVFPVYGTAAVALLLLALLMRTSLAVCPLNNWLWLFLMALFPQIVGHSSLNWALGHLPATYVALVLLAEPIGSTLLAWLILEEVPVLTVILGGGLILAGLWVANRKLHR